MVGRQDAVAVHEQQVLPAARPDPRVAAARGLEPEVLVGDEADREPHPAPVLLHHARGLVGRAVVRDGQLEPLSDTFLAGDGVEARQEVPGPLVGADDDRKLGRSDDADRLMARTAGSRANSPRTARDAGEKRGPMERRMPPLAARTGRSSARAALLPRSSGSSRRPLARP